ncbi:MAG: RHS repeat-associated core domain-containing protein, partial [Balneolaceae bacterium]
NRPIEIGAYSGGTDFDSANPDVDTFPTSGHTANINYYYDGDQKYWGAQNQKGRISKVSYRDLSTASQWGNAYYSYNKLGLVSKLWQQIPGNYNEHVLDYNYDELGRVTRVDYQEVDLGTSFRWRYNYDVLGRLSTVETTTNGSTWIKDAEYVSYLADGQVGQMTLGNTNIQTVDYSYTIKGWLEKINDINSIGSDKFAMLLDYNLNGNISQQKWRQPKKDTNLATYDYTYDTANRLTSALNGDQSYCSGFPCAFDVNMTYDKNGNIANIFRHTDGYGYNYDMYSGMNYNDYDIQFVSNSNKIDSVNHVENVGGTSTNHGGLQVSYDASGNMTKNELQGFSWVDYDWRNLPSQMIAGSKTLTYAYDASGHRVKKSVSGGGNTTFYVRGANGEVITWFDTNYNYNFPITTPSGEMVGVVERRLSQGITERRYYLKDHLGSIRTTVNQNGAIDGYDDYYPFGLVMPGRSSNSGNPNDDVKFTGYELDDEAGLNLYHANARFYDPVVPRFGQIDPLSDQFPNISPYAYGNNNPLRFTDPTGMAPMDDIYLNSETNEYSIIRTDDEHDMLYVDGEAAGATDVSAWEDGASNIYDSYTNYFMENSWAISDDNWLGNFNRAERMEVKQGIFNARMAMGQKSTLITMTKIGAMGAAGISTLGVGSAGVGFALGSRSAASLFNLGTKAGTISSAISASESYLSGDIKTGSLKLAIGIGGFNPGYSAIKTATMLDDFERGVATFGLGFSETIFNNQ